MTDLDLVVQELTQGIERDASNRANGEARETHCSIDDAMRIFRDCGIRFMNLQGIHTIGVWSDRDGPAVRAAIRAVGMESLPMRYLDGDGIPARFKVRLIDGEPFPLSGLSEPGADCPSSQAAPVRSIAINEWKAAELNRLFLEHGVTDGQPGRITAETVAHGEHQMRKGRCFTDGKPGNETTINPTLD